MKKKKAKKQIIKKKLRVAKKKKPVKKASAKKRPTKPRVLGKKKKVAKKKFSTKKKIASSPKLKPIGKVTHFYNEIRVAIVKFNQNVSVGTMLKFKGATTDFEQAAQSMQYDHATVAIAKKGKLIGIKVKKRVREGDHVYKN